MIGIDIHKYDVRTDLPNAVPGDAVVMAAGAQTQHAAGPRYDQGADFSLRDLHLHVLNEAQPPARADADHFLALQLGNLRCHTHHSLVVLVDCMMQREEIELQISACRYAPTGNS